MGRVFEATLLLVLLATLLLISPVMQWISFKTESWYLLYLLWLLVIVLAWWVQRSRRRHGA